MQLRAPLESFLHRAGCRDVALAIGRTRPDFVEPLRTDRTYFHLTHPKAASQWIQSILVDLFPRDVIKNLPAAGSVKNGSVQTGKFYTSVYLSREDFLAIAPESTPRFFIMRDLRDSLVSLYFSHAKTHAVTDEFVERGRNNLSGLSKEDGLRALIEQNAHNFVRIQSSWLVESERCFRFEDVVQAPEQNLGKILRDILGLEIRAERLHRVCERYSFQRMSGGRALGEEDPNSHLRSGKPGNWREHFTPELIRIFKDLHGEHLIACGYERDLDW